MLIDDMFNAAKTWGQGAGSYVGNKISNSYGNAQVASGQSDVMSAGWDTLGDAKGDNKNAENLSESSSLEQLRHSEVDKAIQAIATQA